MMGDDAKFRMIPLTQVDTAVQRHRNNDEIFNRRYISSLKLSSNYPDIDQFSYSRKFALLVVTKVLECGHATIEHGDHSSRGP
jgi:hypothetical protein